MHAIITMIGCCVKMYRNFDSCECSISFEKTSFSETRVGDVCRKIEIMIFSDAASNKPLATFYPVDERDFNQIIIDFQNGMEYSKQEF